MNVDPDEDEENKQNSVVVLYKGKGGSDVNYPPAKRAKMENGPSIEIQFHPGSKKERKDPNVRKAQQKVATAAAKKGLVPKQYNAEKENNAEDKAQNVVSQVKNKYPKTQKTKK